MQTRRISVMAAFALGCVVALAGTNACSSGNDRNDNTGTPDAGGGNTTPDAGGGNTTPDHSVGAACTADQPQQQGDCDANLTCIQASTSLPGGMCVKVGCNTDADCGGTGVCIDVGNNQKACFRGCDAGVIGSCNRDGYVCQPTGSGTQGVCLPNCNDIGGVCASDSLACQQDGTCQPAAGNSGAFESCDTENCQAGLNCLSFQGGTGGVCFPDCTQAATQCPQGSTCAIQFSGGTGATGKACAKNCTADTDCTVFGNWTCQTQGGNKLCLPPQPTGTQQPGQGCGGTFGACATGASCLGSGASGNCFQGPCTTDADCTAPAGAKCNIQVQGGSKFCATPCTAGSTTCPQGLTCKALGGGNFCLQ